MKEKVLIREVGLRDGLQLLNKFCPTEIKLKWLNQQTKVGFKEMEICSIKYSLSLIPFIFDFKNNL